MNGHSDMSENILRNPPEDTLIMRVENVFKTEAIKNIMGNFLKHEKTIEYKKNHIIIYLYSRSVNTLTIQSYDEVQVISVVDKRNKVIQQYELFSRQRDRLLVCKLCKVITKFTDYRDIGTSDIYFILIYLFYALRFNEPSMDMFNMKFLENHLVNYSRSIEMLFTFISGRLIVNNEDVASLTRQHILGITPYEKEPEIVDEYVCFSNDWLVSVMDIFCMKYTYNDS